MAATTAAGMFQLFLKGHNCEEIAAMNPAFGLGIIVKARIDFGWDQQRQDHIDHLMANARQVVQTTQLEAIQFLAEGMAVYQRLAGARYRKYLQTGNEEDLGDLKDMSFKTYKDLLELLTKLTGSEAPKKSQVSVEHHVVAPVVLPTQPLADRPTTAAEAHDFLKRVGK